MTKKRHTVTPRTMCFVINNNKVLLLKASDKKDWEGMYDPIGGHIEKGESILESALREIKEESGLVLDNIKLCGIVHVSNFFGKEVMMFVTKSETNQSKVVSNEEGELEWVDINNLDSLNVFEDVRPILKKTLELKNGEMFFGTSEFDGKDKLVSFKLEIE